MELPESTSSKTIYVTVRCTNKAGLVATSSSDGVSIVRDRQTSESLVIETLGHSPSHYPVFSNFHGTAEQFRIRLSGFAGDHQIKKYKVCLFVLSPDHDNGWDICATPCLSCTPNRISKILPWDRKSYLTYAILPRL